MSDQGDYYSRGRGRGRGYYSSSQNNQRGGYQGRPHAQYPPQQQQSQTYERRDYRYNQARPQYPMRPQYVQRSNYPQQQQQQQYHRNYRQDYSYRDNYSAEQQYNATSSDYNVMMQSNVREHQPPPNKRYRHSYAADQTQYQTYAADEQYYAQQQQDAKTQSAPVDDLMQLNSSAPQTEVVQQQQLISAAFQNDWSSEIEKKLAETRKQKLELKSRMKQTERQLSSSKFDYARATFEVDKMQSMVELFQQQSAEFF
ncbi:hypothetical protein MP228_006508 [Amoeboaphelidium protococcarum]|nr:hypothetical protein MP228_006508 [Amoeboaphelidium protococcarum]